MGTSKDKSLFKGKIIKNENPKRKISKEYFPVESTDALKNQKSKSPALEALMNVSFNLYQSRNFEEIGKLLYDGLQIFDNYIVAGCKLGVYFKDEDIFEIVYFMHHDPTGTYFETREKLRDLKMFTKLAIEKKKTVFIRNSHSKYSVKIDPRLKELNVRTMIFIPLIHQNKLVGLFSYSKGGENTISDRLRYFMKCLCKIVSVVIAEHLTRKEERKHREEIHKPGSILVSSDKPGIKKDYTINSVLYDLPTDIIYTDYFSDKKSNEYIFEGIISDDPKIKIIFEKIKKSGINESPVIIEGETGTGKELLARAIHNLSIRRSNKCVIINCPTFSEHLVESELFGHVKGSFTDAYKDKKGKIEEAEGGTIFFDEISEIPFTIQSKLLRFLQSKEYEPLGGIQIKKADVRIITASNKKLKDLVDTGKFRSDLFYRLNVIRYYLPPLRERKGDIPLLINHFIKIRNVKTGKKILGIHKNALEILLKYDYPGNIRELENIIEKSFIFCEEDLISTNDLPKEILNGIIKNKGNDKEIKILNGIIKNKGNDKEIKILLMKDEKFRIEEALQKYNGNMSKTCKDLNISRMTLWRKINKLRIKK
jgi:transcriptional regulator with GAF, ATPase, and Fis domain